MLSKANRLHRSEEIKKVLRQGSVKRTPLAFVYYQDSPASTSRVACVVSKGVSPSAVVRHKLQRWLRSVGQKLIKQQSRPTDMVIVARPPLANSKTLAEVQNVLL